MILAIFFVAFLFLLVLPFLPGIIELGCSHDARALSINMDYSRDPRYFGKSFKGILKSALGTESLREGTQELTLSKKETVEIVSKPKIPAGDRVDHLMVVNGNFISLEKATLNKEIYVEGKANIGERNTLRALAAEGKVLLSSQTKVIRWVDAEGGFTADRSCDLGWSISSGSRLKIGPDCRFRRLYGMPILTWREDPDDEITDSGQDCEEIGDSAFISDRDWTTIPPRTKIDKALIFKQNLRIKSNCVFDRDVKTYKKLVLEEGVRIKGNVFAENGISTGPSSRFFGNVFSQESIYLGKGSKIGRAGTVKSVVARKEIVLESGVVIYGYVVAGKRGRVL
jgi:predicted acyltransferase (DUF342 family)